MLINSNHELRHENRNCTCLGVVGLMDSCNFRKLTLAALFVLPYYKIKAITFSPSHSHPILGQSVVATTLSLPECQ